MSARTDDLAERLASIAEELADLALDQLRRAADGDDVSEELDERQLTRARRSVEKAARLLGSEPVGW